MTMRNSLWVVLSVLLLTPSVGAAQDESRRELSEGSAVVRTEENEYKIRILCDDASRPELGFTTEANRVTREATGGRYNMVNVSLRTWKDTDEVVIRSDAGVAWIPRPASAGGVLTMEVDVVPGSFVRNSAPVLLTYDMYKSGDRPDGGTTLRFEANCSVRDPEAPSFRKLGDPGGEPGSW